MGFDLAALKGGPVPTRETVLADKRLLVDSGGLSVYTREDARNVDPGFVYADPRWRFSLNNASWSDLWLLVQVMSPTAKATGIELYAHTGAVLTEYQTQQVASEMNAARMLAKVDGSWRETVREVLSSNPTPNVDADAVPWLQRAFEELRVFLADARGAVMY